ncbi:MAG TPA: ribbon-helix-helix protein, CopG family [Spirochaetota bacterium]|nr:ribbon-helix-helix protein, CopG family [Spirochaetota bacterium]HOS32668.1 ribbon-helix-helix protein, CopG family [Spirochaetota bacterium]HOS54705.1 ribbon-helix-helix protein, CopG family [Spirochaetota bacterium]HQF76617.1 ribbon-helix-helix protein, CopG family [Spirochaetota bacterium]HQH31542.1 ribbon-helix-helix protein, CopG family [Spirochaetota bacterium]
MSKTITIRVDDSTYELLKKAANGERRTISNFIEYAALNYLTTENYVSDNEMNEINKFSEDLKKGLDDIAKGNYTIVE